MKEYGSRFVLFKLVATKALGVQINKSNKKTAQ